MSDQSDGPLAAACAELLPLLRTVFGTRTEVTAAKISVQAVDYRVLLLRLTHPALEIVIKLAGPSAAMACPFDRTAVFYRLAAEETRIPMPKIYAVDVTYQTWPWRYIIKDFIPGEEWAVVRPRLDPAQAAAAQRVLGEAVAQLHHIAFAAYGVVDAEGDVHSGQALYPALQARARSIITNPQHQEYFAAILARHEDQFEDPGGPCLCHDDLHQHNILFAREAEAWRLATILDFDKAWAGPAESDLARLDFWRGMTSPAFWDAYAQNSDSFSVNPVRQLLYQLLWCLEYGSLSPQHQADTHRVCAALGVPPPP